LHFRQTDASIFARGQSSGSQRASILQLLRQWFASNRGKHLGEVTRAAVAVVDAVVVVVLFVVAAVAVT
jgi:hypothetical protein